MLTKTNKPTKYSGDTLIEVLIAIAIASFAIGTSYALANKSLQNAITASDRNHALNIAQNQIAELKLRHAAYVDEASFNVVFGVSGNGSPYPYYGRQFCLADNATTKDSPDWAPRDNKDIKNDADANDLAKYNEKCVIDKQYYINITAMITDASKDLNNKTVFRISVHWPTVGGGANSSAVIYYRLNSAKPLGAAFDLFDTKWAARPVSFG